MAGKLNPLDRIFETCVIAGAGDYNPLLGAAVGYQPVSVIGVGNLVPYNATDGTAWEIGIGTYQAGPSRLQRTIILASSNGGAAVNWGGANTINIRCGMPAAFANTRRLSKSVAGAADVTLTLDEAFRGILEFTGVLTGNINVIVPTTEWEWTAYNNTTGAFSLAVKTVAGTGKAVTQGKRALLLCDGTNVEAQFTDGAQLGTVVGMPRMYKSGMLISNDVGTPNTVLDIAVGKCRDSTDTVDIVAGSAVTKTTGAFAAGTGNGGAFQSANRAGTATFNNASAAVVGVGTAFLTDFTIGDIIFSAAGNGRRITAIADDTHLTVSQNFTANEAGVTYKRGGLAKDAWYRMFALNKDSDNSFDCGLATSVRATPSDLPAGYSKFRSIGTIYIDSTGAIKPFLANDLGGGGIDIAWKTIAADVSNTSQSNAGVNYVLPIPLGIKVKVTAQVAGSTAAAVANNDVRLYDPAQADVSVTSGSGLFSTHVNIGGAAGTISMTDTVEAWSDTSAQLRAIASHGQGNGFTISVVRYIDPCTT